MSRSQIKKIFRGRVRIETLFLLEPPFKKVVNGPKRLLLEKGELAEIYDSQVPIRHIAYVEFPKGKMRGGHYHLREEFFYIIRGKLLLKVIDVTTRATQEAVVKEGDLISIKPKIAHIFQTIKAGHVIEFSQKRFYPKDTIIWTK